MELTFAQDSVKNIFNILGANWFPENGRLSLRMNEAFAYIGAKNFMTSLEDKQTKTSTVIVPYLKKGAWVDADFDTIELGIGISFMPNFGRKKIKFFVSLDAGRDLFDFRIFDLSKKYQSKMIYEITGIYDDMLKECVENKYNELIKTLCQGFIPLD